MTDIALTDQNDLPRHPRHIRGLEAALQQLRLALRLFAGEAQQDETWELPWLEWLAQKPVPTAPIRAAVRDRIERVGFEVESLTVDGGADIVISGTLRWRPGADDEAVVELGVEADRAQALPAVTVAVVEGATVV